MTRKIDKRKLFYSFLALIMAILLIVPMMIQSPAEAASKKTPARPAITRVTATKNSATVTWKKSKYATSYRIYYKHAGTRKWTTLATISSKNLKYTHKSSRKHPLKGGRKYTYTVRAYNKYGRKWSSYDKKGKTVTIPTVPSIVKTRVKANNYKQTTVTWTKSINATNYLVYYRSADTTKWTRIANVSSKTLKYVHKSSRKYPVKAGRTYYYMVRGYNKTFKTYGSYNKAGLRVVIPEKPAATSTATPTVAPTATPKPTQRPKPTATPKPTQKPKPTATPKPTETPLNTEKFIKEVIRLTNIERQKAGKNPVQENAALDKGAAVRAKECALVKYSHTRPDGTNANTAYHEAGAGNIRGENIAVGFRTPKEFVNGVVNSPGHYVTMADSGATHIGVGCYKKDGVIYWVQIFAKDPDQKFTLTVDANGGTFPDKGGVEKYTIQVPAGMKFSLTNITKPEKLNAKFQKWTAVDSTDIPYGVEDYIIMYETQTLKANWTENPS